MGEMAIMGKEGDTKLIWDAENDDEIQSARKTFDRLTGKGHLAFSVKKTGKQGKRIKEFDPDAEKMILVPRVVGG